MLATFLLFYALPFVVWSRSAGKPDQAVLFDFGAGRAYVFGFEFWPQDLFLLASVLIAAALALFLTNTLVGRVWCGFSCPQTLWTDLFFIIERWSRKTFARIGLPRAASLAKHAIWLAIAVATGLTIVSYFTPARVLWPAFLGGATPLATTILVLIFSAATYLLAGYAREAVCTHMCPWPRFQAAMLDLDTKVVAYREKRGEPRGALKRQAAAAVPAGDCVDCGLCVAVCPTRIDIRDGMQLACIGCGLCADACDGIMSRIDRPQGLIAFVSERDLEAEAGLPDTSPPRFRPRIMAFSALLLAALCVTAWTLLARDTFTLSVAPERSPPFVRLSDGSIRNIYALRLTFREQPPAAIIVEAAGLAEAKLQISHGGDGTGSPVIAIPPGASQSLTARLLVTVPAISLRAGRSAYSIKLLSSIDKRLVVEAETYFWAPEPRTAP